MLAGCTPWPEEFARRYREQGYWEGITLFEMLRRSAAAAPTRIAVVDGERRATCRELLAHAEQLAAGLWQLGLRPQERVLFQLGNGLQFLAAFLALLRIGAIPVMVLPAHRRAEIAHFARHAQPVAHFGPARSDKFDYPALARAAAAECASLRAIVVDGEAPAGAHALADLRSAGAGPAAQAALARVLEPPAGEVALMLLSGGTTGMPKLIPRTHDDYVYTARRAGAAAGFGADTVFLAVLPMAHNYTLACPGVLGTLAHGGTVVIAHGTAPEDVFPLLERERVTAIGAAVPLAARWLQSGLFGRHDFSSLRSFINGGAKLAPELRRRVEERFGCTYQENFGTGEGLINMTRLDDPEEIRLYSSGRPISAADEIRIVDERGAELPAGATGELAVRGPNTVRGYYNAPEETAAAYTPEGFYRMGDVGRLVDGYIYLEGRRKELINRGGEKFSGEEVENHVLAHPSVASACVVAMPDPAYGEKACAFVILRQGCTLALPELVAFLRTRGIAHFKFPERLETVAEFPLSPAGKILRRELRERLRR